MPPRESLREEARRRGVSLYQVRVERGARENLTKRTAVGRGPIPTAIARKVERQRQGHPRALPVKTQEKYRPTIAAYEKGRYGHLVTAKIMRRKFDSKEQAELWAESNEMGDVLAEYGEVNQLATGRWELSLLR